MVYATLIPDFCTWCYRTRIVKGSCQKCGTRYGQKIVKEKKIKTESLHLGKDWYRLRVIKFSWEI